MRHRGRWVASLALLCALIAIAVILAASHAHKGTGIAPGVSAKAGLAPVQLGQASAYDYNPFGTGPENRDQIDNVVDSDPSTTWSTERYYDGTLHKAGGTGLGLYLDAKPSVEGRALEIQTPTPGFAVQVYVANHVEVTLPYGSSESLAARGWQGPVGSSADVHDGERIRFTLSGRYRYYLLWMTALPPKRQMATIADVTLFK
jgi:hypothetical protein